ncbi:MAG: hypothetical protein IPP95_06155 [Flavobacteriales bacterium]|nr:MAG: hypothetical protein IPP95_06155 [Flavobacteriales bacterium]
MKKRKVEKEKAFDYAKFEQEAIQGLTEGKGPIGEHGVPHRPPAFRRLRRGDGRIWTRRRSGAIGATATPTRP